MVADYYTKLNLANPHALTKRAKLLQNKQQKFVRMLENQTETQSPTLGKRKRTSDA